MDIAYITAEMERNQGVFWHLLHGLEKEMYAWKPAPEKWNLVEVVGHLYDEEREDFRARIKHTLENPQLPLASIDPRGWVTSRNYAGQDYEEALQRFLSERVRSIEWLRSLQEVKWDNVHRHPSLGDISAAEFLASWLAHDYLHIKQISRIKYDYWKMRSEQKVDYAGEWK